MQCNIAIPDLAARLSGTICMYDGIPYYIQMDEGSKSDVVTLYDLLSKDLVQKIKASDPLFDVATPPLGYLQAKPTRVAYAERLPHRQFRQGITPQVLSYQYFSEQMRLQLHSVAFKMMMMQDYPLLKHILIAATSDREYMELALSNNCALVKQSTGVVKVYFRHEEVAFSSVSELKKKNPVIHVPPTTKAWITNKYLSQFDWDIVE